MSKPSTKIDIDFQGIRSFEGSKQAAFEEFCCQIARRQKDVPRGSKFARYRGVGGDGGVECVWILPNGEEWAWQAKYFFKLDKNQLDKSVKTALEIHPKLTRYTICLPFDFTGPTDYSRGYVSENGTLCFFDPSIYEAGPSALLVEKTYLNQFLEQNDLAIAWTVLAEKQVIDMGSGGDAGFHEHSRVHLFCGGKHKHSKGIFKRKQ